MYKNHPFKNSIRSFTPEQFDERLDEDHFVWTLVAAENLISDPDFKKVMKNEGLITRKLVDNFYKWGINDEDITKENAKKCIACYRTYILLYDDGPLEDEKDKGKGDYDID